MREIAIRLLLVALLGVGTLSAQISSVDAGARGQQITSWDERVLQSWGGEQPWLRIRELPNPGAEGSVDVVAKEVVALRKLTDLGFRPLPFIHWISTSWVGGVRAGGGKRVPLDLREIFRRAEIYGRTYGGVVEGFEVENEPDISYVQDNAESYWAFHKAAYLGLKRGAESTAKKRDTMVVMAPLALPPGPFFEQLVANGLFNYTDAFNYHYYGYPEDFSDVYHQFASAVKELGAAPASSRPFGAKRAAQLMTTVAPIAQVPLSYKKRLPVLLTEYGYGGLSKETAETIEGRVQQWRWFSSVGRQIRKLRIAGPMAFYMSPYIDPPSQREFGITDQIDSPLRYKPSDFGERRVLPWMQGVGKRFGEYIATPSLAWLHDYSRRNQYKSVNWLVSANEPSFVVVDFIAGPGLLQLKRYGGYGAERTPQSGNDEAREGDGNFVLYNFSENQVAGSLKITAGRELFANPEALEREWVLKPMERLVVPVTVTVPSQNFAKHGVALRFEYNKEKETDSEDLGNDGAGGRLVAVFSTAFYPERVVLTEIMHHDFTVGDRAPVTGGEWPLLKQGTSKRNVGILTKRKLASYEPRLSILGRWLVSDGLRVEETGDGVWKFYIDRLPAEPERPAMAELPLPDNFAFPDGAAMRFSYRLTQIAAAAEADGEYFEAYFRAENGNLFQVWPRQYAVGEWRDYAELKENYTMAFYGRANLPWRFRDNKPIALVFHFRPNRSALPATYEVRGARVVELWRALSK